MAKNGKARRDKADGAIYPRKNRKGKIIGWLGAYDVWRESGEKKRKTVYAKALLADAISAAKAPLEPARRAHQAENPKVSEYLSSWLSESEHSLKVSAYRRYELSVRCHLSPAARGGRLSSSWLSPPAWARASFSGCDGRTWIWSTPA